MADREIRRTVVTVFDRATAGKTEQQLTASLARAGDEGGKAFLRELRAEFDAKMAELREKLARGLIDKAEFKRQADEAGRVFNSGLLKSIDEARAKGALTDREYQKLTKTLKNVGTEGDKSAGLLNRGFTKVLGVLGALFVADKIRAFGADAIRTATEADAVWNRLAGTLENAGVQFGEVEQQIRAQAAAMQDATTVGDEEFATVLQTLIGVTNDYQSSLDNVQLVADLAAAKQIDLKTAAELVGKVMVGETGTLKRYGIVVGEGADALDVMRERFAGMAENEAKTFGGQVKQLSNAWGDFKESIGAALITAGGGTSVMDVLTKAVQSATGWVERNSGAFADFARGLNDTVIPAGKFLLSVVRAIGDFFSDVLLRATANITTGLSYLASGYALALDAAAKFLDLIGADKRAAAMGAHADAIHAQARALREYAAAAREVAAEERKAAGRGPTSPTRPTTQPRPAPRAPGATTGTATSSNSGQSAALPGITVAAQSTAAPGASVVSIGALDASPIRDVVPIHEKAAEAVADTWSEAFATLQGEMEAGAGAIGRFAAAVEEGGLAGFATLAFNKTRENIARAIEMGAIALGRLAFGDAPGATVAGQSAAGHAAAASAWAVLGGGASAAGGRKPQTAGGVPSVGAANTSAARTATPKNELHITFVGEGFDAVNPRVQQVVQGALQEAVERNGPNGRVYVYRRRAG